MQYFGGAWGMHYFSGVCNILVEHAIFWWDMQYFGGAWGMHYFSGVCNILVEHAIIWWGMGHAIFW